MEKLSWTNSIQVLGEKEVAGVKIEKETQKEKKDRLTRIVCAIVMTFVWTSFLNKQYSRKTKFGRERKSPINKKERNTEGEKKTD